MGVITKQFHKHTTNRIVAPVRGVTRLDSAGVRSAIDAVVTQTPAAHTRLLGAPSRLWLVGTSGSWTVYFGPPSRTDPTKVVPSWQAAVAAAASQDGSATLVTVQLARWKTRDGALVDRRHYEAFRDSLLRTVQSMDASFSMLEAVG